MSKRDDECSGYQSYTLMVGKSIAYPDLSNMSDQISIRPALALDGTINNLICNGEGFALMLTMKEIDHDDVQRQPSLFVFASNIEELFLSLIT
jgi:hypothetical protein